MFKHLALFPLFQMMIDRLQNVQMNLHHYLHLVDLQLLIVDYQYLIHVPRQVYQINYVHQLVVVLVQIQIQFGIRVEQLVLLVQLLVKFYALLISQFIILLLFCSSVYYIFSFNTSNKTIISNDRGSLSTETSFLNVAIIFKIFVMNDSLIAT